MQTRAIPLVVVVAALVGWGFSAVEPSPRPNPPVDTSAYAIVWTPGGACSDEPSVQEDDLGVPFCGLPEAAGVTPR